MSKFSKKIKKRLVIAGGGFSGVTLAKEILKNSGNEFEITLIDRNDYQLFYPALFKVVSSTVEPSVAFSVAALKFSDIFKDQPIKILKKEITGILFDKNQVVLKAPGRGRILVDYDYFVFAVGAEPDFVNVEVARNYALTFKSFEDALKIKTETEYVLKNKAKREDINIVVVGGGVTGCTLIAELYDYVHKLPSLSGHPRQTINFKLVAGKDVLHALSPWTRKKIRKVLEKMGVEIITGCRVGSLGDGGCILDDGTFVNADVLIWTGGIKPSSLIEVFPEENKHFKNNKFYLRPTRHLGLGGRKNVFVIGDVAYTGRVFSRGPTTAQSAIRQAKYIAKFLSRSVRGKSMGRYRPAKSIYAIDMGKHFSLADIGPLGITGWPARYLHRQGFLSYLKNIMPLHKAIDWLEKYKSL